MPTLMERPRRGRYPHPHRTRRPSPSRVPLRLVALLAGLAVAAATAIIVAVVGHTPQDGDDVVTVILADQITAEEGAPVTPPELLDRADALAASGRNRLVVVQAGGDGGRQAGPAVELRVEREPGRLENDATARRAGVENLLRTALGTAAGTPVTGRDRDLAGLLSAVSSVRGPGPNEVWLRTFGLGTRDPADARVLMAADPQQAAAAVAAALPDVSLARTDVHLVLAPPAGDQPWLTARTDAWRTVFAVDLLRALGARVVSAGPDLVPRPGRAGAPTAPIVENLPDTTPRLPATPSGGPVTVPLDTAQLFQPDTATFAAGEAAAAASLRPLVDAMRTGRYGRIEIVGRCARFGPADTARALSLQRATAVAALLGRAGLVIADADVRGLGYDSPLPPGPQDPVNRQVTVTVHPAP